MTVTSHWISKKAVAWALYDFADTAFSALFITFFFPILIKVHLGGNEFQIGLAMGLSVVFAALFVPVIGAYSDATGKRLPILIWAALATAIITVFAGYSFLYLALFLGFLAHITHLISKDVYDAKMIDIVPRQFFGALSGFGVAVGYIGTIASLVVGFFLMQYFGWESISGIRAMFFESGFFYVVFSLPLFFLVPDVVNGTKMDFWETTKAALFEVKKTLQSLPQFPVFGRFLAASFFYNNAMNTTIIFLSLYAREVQGITTQEFFPIFALMSLTAAIGSFLTGFLSDRFGPPPVIRFNLLIWMALILALIFYPSFTTFLIVGMVGGAALGANWALNRHMVLKVAPEKNVAQLLGFEGLTEKFSGVFGPIIFGFLAYQYDYSLALGSMLIFFLIGLFLMRKL